MAFFSNMWWLIYAKELCFECLGVLIIALKTTTSYFKRKSWPVSMTFTSKIKQLIYTHTQKCLGVYNLSLLLWAHFRTKFFTRRHGIFFFPEIRSTYLCKKAMPCLRRTFGIALCSFSHENNNLLFRMKILTRRYGIFVSKYDLLVYPKKLCLGCLEPLIITLSLFSHENNDLLFQTKKKFRPK